MTREARPTLFGQYSVAEPLRLDLLHVHDGTALREVEHTIPIPVLDQEDLFAQAIDTSKLIPGAKKVDALGSCTANAGTAHLAERWAAAGHNLDDIRLPGEANWRAGLSAADAHLDEEFAITLYHLVTDQTGNPSTEWPPTDCGSTGLYVCHELIKQGLSVTYKTASSVTGALSLLQTTTVMQGGPWFNSWMEPDSDGFIDGDGSLDALHAAINSGVAGGHETLQRAIPQLAQTRGGKVELDQTVIKVRNSWSEQFALSGDYLLHASTLSHLSRYFDYKAVVIN